MRHGRIRGVRGKAFQNVLGSAEMPLPVRRSSAEQSNTSILYGDRFILKLFRHQEPGLNPDAEIGRYLTEKTNFDRIPPFAGSIELGPAAGAEPTILAMLQGLVANEGDGWKWTVEELDRYFETCAPLPFPESATADLRNPGPFWASRLKWRRPSRRIWMLPVPLVVDSRDAFGACFTNGRSGFRPRALTTRASKVCLWTFTSTPHVLGSAKERMAYLPGKVVQLRPPYSASAAVFWIILALKLISNQRFRIHGDYHLGQCCG
jgi:maltose alpha-D-glucosyltransferase/alpha-amylase